MQQLLWLLIVVLAVFGAWQFLLALRAGPGTGRPATPDGGGNDDETPPVEHVSRFPEPLGGEGDAPAPRAEPSMSAASLPDPFAVELELRKLRREMGSLRAALEVQQDEIAGLRAELEQRALEPAKTEIASGASPEYNEALALARRGLGVDEIAARCGITRAEAELVVSLAAGGH
jgi:hypothetical protein